MPILKRANIMKLSTLLLASIISTNAQAAPKIREATEWSSILITNTHQHDKPRVLFIGDSITGAYFPLLQSRLADVAYVSEYATSKSIADPDYLTELKIVLREGAADIIHLNNGMHGVGYNETQYKKGYETILSYLKAHCPRAKIILTTTTPRRIPTTNELDSFTPRIVQRNAIVQHLAAVTHSTIDDLYALTLNHPEFCIGDGTHYNALGIEAEAEEVEAIIRQAIENN